MRDETERPEALACGLAELAGTRSQGRSSPRRRGGSKCDAKAGTAIPLRRRPRRRADRAGVRGVCSVRRLLNIRKGTAKTPRSPRKTKKIFCFPWRPWRNLAVQLFDFTSPPATSPTNSFAPYTLDSASDNRPAIDADRPRDFLVENEVQHQRLDVAVEDQPDDFALLVDHRRPGVAADDVVGRDEVQRASSGRASDFLANQRLPATRTGRRSPAPGCACTAPLIVEVYGGTGLPSSV